MDRAELRFLKQKMFHFEEPVFQNMKRMKRGRWKAPPVQAVRN